MIRMDVTATFFCPYQGGFMELALISARQVVVFFMLIMVGFFAVKAKALKPEARQHFSSLLVSIVVPCMIVNSYITEFDAEVFHGIMLAFIHSFILIMIGLIIAVLAARRMGKDNAAIFEFAMIFSNAGYMGFPLIQALFGNEGLLYASSYNTVFNILIWTYGYARVSGQTDAKKVVNTIVRTPAMIAVVLGLVIYLLQIPVPELIHQPISQIGGLNTPISMMITGMILAGSDLSKVIRDRAVAAVISIRLFLIPAVCLLIYGVLHISFGMASEVVLLLEACPCAAISTVFAVQFHYDEEKVAGAVILSTLLSILTLPVTAFIITTLL